MGMAIEFEIYSIVVILILWMIWADFVSNLIFDTQNLTSYWIMKLNTVKISENTEIIFVIYPNVCPQRLSRYIFAVIFIAKDKMLIKAPITTFRRILWHLGFHLSELHILLHSLIHNWWLLFGSNSYSKKF